MKTMLKARKSYWQRRNHFTFNLYPGLNKCKPVIKKALLFFPFLLFSLSLYSSNDSLRIYEDSLKKIAPLIFKSNTDAEKYSASNAFSSLLEKTLMLNGSFEYPFDSLKTIGKTPAPDGKFRLYNWNLPKQDGTHEYFGFLQVRDKKKKIIGLIPYGKKRYKILPLIDKSTEIKNPENTITDNNKWYGMLYYSCLKNKYKGKTYYTLLALDLNDNLTRKKIIDVLTFDKGLKPSFGADIFTIEKKFPKRFILEYSAEYTISLRFNHTLNMIVFNHLIPKSPTLTGQYQFYGPDFSFDGFQFVKGKWQYMPDVDARNEPSEKDKMLKKPGPVNIPKNK